MVGAWGSWTRTQSLGPRTDQFGYASSISTYNDVTTVIVTACGGDQSAYIYVLTAGTFTQTQRLQVATASNFGYSATMGYGWLIIGANGDSPNGAQYLFMYNTPSSSYSLQQRFTPADGVSVGLTHPNTGKYSSSATSTDFNTGQIALGDFYGGDDAIGTKVGEAMLMNIRYSPAPTPIPTPAPTLFPTQPSPRPTPTPTMWPTRPTTVPTPQPSLPPTSAPTKHPPMTEMLTGFLVVSHHAAASSANGGCTGPVRKLEKISLEQCFYDNEKLKYYRWVGACVCVM